MAETRVPMTLRDFFFSDPFFKSSWEDFDKVREAMMTESKQLMEMFDKITTERVEKQEVQQREEKDHKEEKDEHVDKEKEDVHKKNEIEKKEEGDEVTDSHWLFPRMWMMPILRTVKNSEVIRIQEDKEKLEVSLDTSQFRPDELKVSVDNGMITVEGKHEEKSEDGDKRVLMQFVRSFNLPQGTKPQDVISNLSSDGVLVITAPKDEKKAIEVNIVRSG